MAVAVGSSEAANVSAPLGSAAITVMAEASKASKPTSTLMMMRRERPKIISNSSFSTLRLVV
jgi:hypothetical protein